MHFFFLDKYVMYFLDKFSKTNWKEPRLFSFVLFNPFFGGISKLELLMLLIYLDNMKSDILVMINKFIMTMVKKFEMNIFIF
jgi:hypothetical protein